MDNQERAAPQRLLRYGLILGVLLIVAAMLWTAVARGHNLWEAWFGASIGVVDVVLGGLVGTVFSLVMWQVGQYYRGLIEIRNRLVDILDLANYRWHHNLLLAIVAAVPEEVFFRGAVQPTFGLLATALIFGFLHAITPTYFVYATVAGLGLGLMMEWHNTLWMPIAAHFMVDFVSLQVLSGWARQNQKPAFEEDGREVQVG